MLESVDMGLSKIKILNNDSGEVLYEFELDQQDEAYAKATELEEIGLDITLKSPGLTETLCDSLGLENDARADYEQSVVAEMDDHDGSCCVTYQAESPSDKLQ